MGYQTMADGLLALLRTRTPASTRVVTGNSSAKSDIRVLSGARSSIAVILTPGPFTRERVGFKGACKSTTWTIEVNIYSLYTSDEEAHERLIDVSQDIQDTVDAYPKLDGVAGVYIAEIESGDPPAMLMNPNGSGPHWWVRVIRVAVTEDSTVTELE